MNFINSFQLLIIIQISLMRLLDVVINLKVYSHIKKY